MQADGPLVDRDQCAEGCCLLELRCQPQQHVGERGGLDTLDSQSNHGRAIGTADRQESMEVRVHRHDACAELPCRVKDLRIFRRRQSRLADVSNFPASLTKMLRGGARHALIEQEFQSSRSVHQHMIVKGLRGETERLGNVLGLQLRIIGDQ